MTNSKENMLWAGTILKRLSALPYCPSMREGWDSARDELLNMLPSTEAGEWLIGALLRSEQQFPAPARMREVLSMRFKPEDERAKDNG